MAADGDDRGEQEEEQQGEEEGEEGGNGSEDDLGLIAEGIVAAAKSSGRRRSIKVLNCALCADCCALSAAH